jgi:putative peptidoglycan lipid II flippase
LNLLRAAATISGLTFLSRVTGLVRDVVLARMFGASAEMDAFNVAFRLPNLLRRVFAEGAFSQAFVPFFAASRAHDGDDAAKALLSDVMSALFWILLAVSVLGVLAAPALVWLIATGFAEQPDKFALAAQLTRWMFPYILFMSLVACLAAALNTFKRFAVPAFTPVLLNLAFIGAALGLAPRLQTPILALAIAVLVGGTLQLSIQYAAVTRIGLVPRLVSPAAALRAAGVQRVLRQMVPALFGVSVAQISLIINTNIASHLPTGSVSWVTYADRLMELPTALLGVAIGTVLLPGLSAAFANDETARYRSLIDWGMRLTLLIASPATLGLALLAPDVISVLFEGRRFTAFDVTQTANALVGYCIGLVGLIAVKILAPAYYARRDLKTPVKIAVLALIVTQAANLVLVPRFAHAGLTAAISVGALLNAVLLYLGLRRAGLVGVGPGWAALLLKLSLALVALAACILAARWFWPAIGGQIWMWRAVWLAGVMSLAAAVYFGVLWALGLRLRDFALRSE